MKKQTKRNHHDNFYEILIETGLRYDSDGVGYEFTFNTISRVRHDKPYWPDSARWAEHSFDVYWGLRDGGGGHESMQGDGEEVNLPLRTLCEIPTYITVKGHARTKDGHEFDLEYTVNDPQPEVVS